MPTASGTSKRSFAAAAGESSATTPMLCGAGVQQSSSVSQQNRPSPPGLNELSATYFGDVTFGGAMTILDNDIPKGQKQSDKLPMALFERASRQWWNLRFSSESLEKLYLRLYAFQQIRRSFRFALAFACLCTLSWTVVHLFVSDFQTLSGYFASAFVLVCLLSALFYFTCHERYYQRFYYTTSFSVAFLLAICTLLVFCAKKPLMSPLATFVTSLHMVLALYLALPAPLYVAVGTALAYSTLYEVLSTQQAPYEHSGVKFALHLCMHLLGVHLYILGQVRDRKSFIKLGQSLLVRQDLEKEKRFVDNMIESVMPKKVAEQLLKDTAELNRRPSSAVGGAVGRGSIFRPFTMNLMTNVSILFADIAGFTKMASNKSADELVDLLNDLFGRFDKLCEATGCEKISTLGDCYYCVSGCPEPRQDHARCCVEMGLAMCVAIKEFDADRNQEVNMRVGIHTGTVMCGIVGTKRFKFDVFSNDVTLANTMESTGRAGRVHVSEYTKAFLGAEYALEEGEPHNGMRTYFVIADQQQPKTPSMSKGVRPGARPTGVAALPMSPTARSQRSLNVSSSGVAAGPPSAGLQGRHLADDDMRHIDSTTDVGAGAAAAASGRQSNLSRLLPHIHPSAQQTFMSLKRIFYSRQSDEFTSTKKSASMAHLSHKTSSSLKLTPSPNGNPTKGGQGDAQASDRSTNLHSTTSTSHPTALESGDSRRDKNDVQQRLRDDLEKVVVTEIDLCNNNESPRYAAALPYEKSVGEAVLQTTTDFSDLDQATSDNLGVVDFMVHATSITRFDTAHMDFDQRLVECIENSYTDKLDRSSGALNPWTLYFTDKRTEDEYRRHFSADFRLPGRPRLQSQHQVQRKSRSSLGSAGTGAPAHPDDKSLGAASIAKIDETFRVASPKFSTFMDVLIAAVIYLVTSTVSFCVFGTRSLGWLIYFGLMSCVLLAIIAYAFWSVRRRHQLPRLVTHWSWRHMTSLLLIWAPLGAAASNLLCGRCDLASSRDAKISLTPDNSSQQLVAAYIFFVALLAHLNFSQLFYAVKSVAASILAFLICLVVFLGLCAKDECITRPAAKLLHQVYSMGVKDRQVSHLVPPALKFGAAFLDSNFKHTVLPIGNKSECTTKYLFHPAIWFSVPVYRLEILLLVLLSLCLIVFMNYQFEHNFRISYYGDKNVYRTIQEMSTTKYQADWLLDNIMPHHIQEQLMRSSKYSENHEMVAVVFASVVNWHEMYEETFEGGREFLRVLNELVADLDELLDDRSRFTQVEKIKTIGTTYMVASGLNTGRRRLSVHPYSHLYELMEFAIALQEVLENFNKDLLNFEFKMKIGYNIGPVTAGVIGTTKLYYDIWGDTVNISSRMYSTGVVGRIQVSKKARDMLQDVYDFQFRDRIEVKGIDGGMDVYLLQGRRENMHPPGTESQRLVSLT